MNQIHLDPLPKLRALELRPHLHNGESYILLRDPLQLSEQSLLLPQALAPLLAFLDGERTAAQIVADFHAGYGVRVEVHMIAQVVSALDECYLLENSRYYAVVQGASGELQRAGVRPMTIAGAGYPARGSELAAFLDAYLPTAQTSTHNQTPAAVGLLSPHIDYARGGPVYGQVWSRAAQAARAADAVVIFATDHYGYDPFTLTRQDYATPYGVLPTDGELTRALAHALGEGRAFAGELRHRREHSIELVTVWLHHMRGGVACPVVPILCGSHYEHILQAKSPATHPQVAAVLDALHRAMADRRILVVASGDLAHVGPAFQGTALDTTARAELRAADEALLRHMRAGDPEGFFRAIRAVQDCNNVCGVMPIYLSMKLLARAHGDITGVVTGYAACSADAANTSAVTIAGVVFS